MHCIDIWNALGEGCQDRFDYILADCFKHTQFGFTLSCSVLAVNIMRRQNAKPRRLTPVAMHSRLPAHRIAAMYDLQIGHTLTGHCI